MLLLEDLTEHDKRDIINDAETENTPKCCGVPMQVDIDSTEYWGVVKQHTEYSCRVCGEFFIR